MPVGPSHGSRSSGSSSSRSSSSSSRSSSSRSYRSSSSSSRSYRSSRSSSSSYYYDDGYGYSPRRVRTKKEKQIIALIWGIVISAIFAVISFSVFCSNVGPTNLIRQDAYEYAQIIQRAQNNEEGYYLITINNIEVVGIGKDGYNSYFVLSGSNNSWFYAYAYIQKDGVDYYYFEYSFTDDEGRRIEAESYTCYSNSAVRGLTEMTFAYTKLYDNDGSWDVIDVNYSLDKNLDFWEVESATVGGIVVALLSSGLIALFIYMLVRIKQNKKIFAKGFANETTATVEPDKVCIYCGTTASKNAKTCSSCGAKKFKVNERK